jgi:tetratricopeptide (TPR) repeat protein
VTDQARREIGQAKAGDAGEVLQAGVAALRTNLAEEALPLLAEAVQTHPDDAWLWQLKGLLHRTAEDLAPAVEALSTAAALAPADAFIAHSLACATIEAGLPAVDAFERALALAPGEEAPLLGLAESHLVEGETGRAVALLEDRLGRDPSWLQGHLTLARMRTSRGAPRAATAGFERALAAMPGAVPLWVAYLQLLYQSERYEEIPAMVARARAAAGAQRDFDAAEAVATAELGEIEAADPLFDALRPSGDMTLAVPYVRHLLRAGRPERAGETAAAALKQAPQPILWSYLSAAWRLTGDPRWQWLEGDPGFVGIYDLAERLPPLDALADRLRALHKATHQPLHQSVRGGTQTEGHLFKRIEPEIRALRRAVVEAVEAHVARLPPRDPGHPLLGPARSPIRFASAWSVRLAGGGRHANHVHPGGWLSSALYVALPEAPESGPPGAGWLTLGEISDLDLGLPPLARIEPRPGRLVLFPSTMWHGTVPFESGERLTVAFDVATPVG